MLAKIQPYLSWLHYHPHAAGIITFLICFAECLVIVGLFIPGTVLMTAIGALIGTNIIPFTSTTLWAISGALLGDFLSFWIGAHFHRNLLECWPFRKHPHLFNKGEAFFHKHGGKSIFFGRFVGPVRPLLPVIAGMLSMPWKRFAFADIFSAILWAPVYLLPGILLGKASQELPPELATRLILLVIGALLVFWCVSWLLKRIYLLFSTAIERFFTKIWLFVQTHASLQRFKKLLLDPQKPGDYHQLALLSLSLVTACLFIFFTISVHYHAAWVSALNDPIYYFMRSMRTTFCDPIFVGITLISPKTLVLFWGILFIWFCIKRFWWAAFHWLGIGLVCFAGTSIVKHFTHIPRPPGLLQSPTGWSFPSGHSTFSVTFFGFLAVLLTEGRSLLCRRILYTFVSILAGSVIFSRLYLGAHWLTDVTGSFLFAITLIVLTTISYRRRITPRLPLLSTLLVASVALVLSWSLTYHKQFQSALRDYTPTWTIQTIPQKTWWNQNGEQIPLMRTNRFGKPIQVFNLQWAGKLTTVEALLAMRGWELIPKGSLMEVLLQLTGTSKEAAIPLFSQFYEDRKPVLVMFKTTENSSVLILRLWDAHLNLDNGKMLWLGTVSYHQPWHTMFFHLKQKAKITASATDLLTPDLSLVNWKIIIPSGQTILLIEEK